jgi:hypothetical protein
VQDPGIAILSNAAGQVSESFDETQTGGGAAGLSISRSMIGAHRGRFSASASQGKHAPSHSPFRRSTAPGPLWKKELRECALVNRYLSTIDAARHTADDCVVQFPEIQLDRNNLGRVVDAQP